MCGIAGLFDADGRDLERRAAAMTRALAHRGPDGRGVWVDAPAGLALGHTRLAIRDLSATGAQPMASASGRFALSYNGELYNAEEMRAALPGHRWRGTSDSEVLLEFAARFGIRAALAASNGIFALALWDRDLRTLWLARDRFGVKPLCWFHRPGLLLFGSELKALEADPAFPRDLDPMAVQAFLGQSCVPAPLTIWQGARKLGPGELLTFRPDQPPQTERWWDSAQALREGIARQGRVGRASLVEELDALLADSVRRQTVSDVPIGAFLSGGLDSSAIATYLAAAGVPVETFTIGFEASGYDESAEALRIAQHLGLRHHAHRMTEADALALVPELGSLYDEPFADSSQIPTLLLCRFARRSVKVVLSGDGGDELFAGYNRHIFALRQWPTIAALPMALRALAATGLGLPRPSWLDRLGGLAGTRLLAEKTAKLASVLGAADLDDAYGRLCRQGLAAVESPLAPAFAGSYLEPARGGDVPLDPLDRMQFLDLTRYLPDDVLAKVDRASMSVGLEVRVPWLDHRLIPVAFADRPIDRIAGGRGKALLRDALAKRLPRALFDAKPKMGFAAPIAEWLRGPLRSWAGDLLSPAALARDGMIDANTVARWWSEHQSGRRNRHHALWNVLMFRAWHLARPG